ncbi:hypothetical protein [Domibacillus iocasae]|uniref:Uncharacterized protein n=1 Tax=Domibacillus iocasae TaxID=1714016 RepID=A0A1E7DR67_9BACI|nr:hypothetical protein [Domibacillus iocasae]OES45529.1 hypothetical protein BA724_01540 [Domibacillus iocasae]
MHEKQHNAFYTVDYQWTGQQVLFVKVAGFDAEKGKEFEGLIKFVKGAPFGDLIHPQQSSLSADCIKDLRDYLTKKFAGDEFN